MSGSTHAPGRVAAIVVEYHSGESLERCLDSLRDNQVDQIVVVDNGAHAASSTRSVALSSGVTLAVSGRNLGFGGGVNLGAASADAELLLICNPDIVLEPGALAYLRDRLASSERAGAVGPALLDEKGQVVQSARAFPTLQSSWQQAFLGLLHPSGQRSRQYRSRNRSLAAGGVVDWVTGACILVRADAFHEIGGFDGRYFLYVEEVDLCWRLHAAGWEVLYEPRARVTHVGSVSTSAHPYRAIVSHHRSLWRFVSNTTSDVNRVALPFVAVALLVRCAAACAICATRRRRRPSRLAVELRPDGV
jgi:N-acetylglucosaminyl-diphospho-decaprenol L-rhamnosyltransferase